MIKFIKRNKKGIAIGLGVVAVLYYGKFKYTQGIWRGVRIGAAIIRDSQEKFAATIGSDFVELYVKSLD